MLFGRVTDYNTRTNLRTPPSKATNPFNNPAFAELDKLVCVDFLESLPPAFKPLGLSASNSLDTDLYMVQVVPHAYVLLLRLSHISDQPALLSATITLHNPYLNFNDLDSISTQRCVNATRSILAAYYSLSETSLDITRLHPFVTVRCLLCLLHVALIPAN